MEFSTNLQEFLIKKLREEKVITQVALAEKLGISNIAINKWLNGGAIDMDRIPTICEILNVTPNELFGYDTPTRRKEADDLFDAYLSHKEYKEAIDKLLEINK